MKRIVNSVQLVRLLYNVLPRSTPLWMSLSRSRLSSGAFGAEMSHSTPSLISSEIAIHLAQKDNKAVKFLDGSWHMDKSRDAYSEYLAERIPCAQYFDIDAAADTSNPLPHMLPSPEVFSEYVARLGISSTDHVVVYASKNCFSMPRVWWTFKVFGHERVSILNGGIEAWKAAGGQLQSGSMDLKPIRGTFQAKYNASYVRSWQQVLQSVKTGAEQIVDARSAVRFRGEVPEPRAGVARGRIPGSLSLPLGDILAPDDVTKFRSLEEIRQIFDESGVVFGSNVITSCGSGVSAAVLTFAMHMLGNDLSTAPIYDGSWSEWGSRDDLPKIL